MKNNSDSDFLTEEEVVALDSRIKSCVIENANLEIGDTEICVKICFNCQLKGGSKMNGHQELIAKTKADLFAQVRHFMQSEKNGWRII